MARRSGIVRWLYRWIQRRSRGFRRWIEYTDNLVHLSVLLAIPVLMGILAAVSNTLDALPYLLFPPLASGSYMLFANPERESAAPRRFVGGLTAGALCGWLALELTARYWYQIPPGQYQVHGGAVAFGLFLTGAVTWGLDLQEASAYSTALLVHVTGTAQLGYVVSVFLSAGIVAIVFVTWRTSVYEKRAAFLYESVQGDDHVLVPMTDERARATAMLGARLAAAHEAGKVVLLDVVDDEAVARAERRLIDRNGTNHTTQDSPDPSLSEGDRERLRETGEFDESTLDDIAEQEAVSATADELEEEADRIETKVGVPCEVAIAVDGEAPASTITRAAQETNCDLIAIPYEERYGGLSPTIKQLFVGDIDVLVHRSHAGRTRWKRIMVPVRKAGGVAHSMIDFATRLAGETGHISVCHCISTDSMRRRAEDMLANLVETFDGVLETRVAVTDIQSFLAENAGGYDLVIIGSSQDRSSASRFISPPTFERLDDVETDVAIVDRNFEHDNP